MSYVQAQGAKLFVQDTGAGMPIVFVHEMGADYREWEAQVRWFSRRYRCLAFSARGTFQRFQAGRLSHGGKAGECGQAAHQVTFH